ncbi:MAG: chalcone isomerase family protein [Gammaproteobacteria bacterium]|jgi:hypothetical protein
MTRVRTTIFACLAIASQPLQALTINGTDIPDSVSLPGDGTQLVLNGAGVREKFFMDIYIGALYLESRMHDPAAILADTGHAGILMHFTYSEVSREKIIAGWVDGLEANLTEERLQAIKPRLEKFNSLFRTVVKGDVIRIDYAPDTGTQVRINGEWRGSIAGNDFYRDLLRIWLGASPVSKSLKHDMLGLD